LSKNFQWQSCSAINYLSSGINILARDDPVFVKFGPKDINPNRKVARFTFPTRRAVQSAIADLLVGKRAQYKYPHLCEVSVLLFCIRVY